MTTLKGGFADNQVSSDQNRIESKSMYCKFFWVHIFFCQIPGDTGTIPRSGLFLLNKLFHHINSM